MPQLSGLDVVRELRSINPGLPMAISSGYISEDLRVRAKELGVRGLMNKEHTLDALGPLLHEALRRPAP